MAVEVPAVCTFCDHSQAFGAHGAVCARCGGIVELQLERDLERPVDQRHPGMWRYHPWLAPGLRPLTLGESSTPVIGLRWSGLDVAVKNEGVLPTGSFKDRGSAVVISFVASRGVERVAEDSSGNAGASMAAYAARARIGCDIYVPRDASAGKLLQARVHGARLHTVSGSRQDVEDAAVAASVEGPTAYVPHALHPYFLEGTRTFAYEVAEQYGPAVPDAVVLPVGAGTLFLGAYRGFLDLHRAGRIHRVPRMFAVQAAACAPLVEGGDRERPRVQRPARSLAEGIAIAAPPRGRAVLRAVAESGGGAVAVEEAAIVEALRRLGRAGLFVEPTAAVALAGLDRLVADGTLRRDDEILVGLTGLGLKAAAEVELLLSKLGGDDTALRRARDDVSTQR